MSNKFHNALIAATISILIPVGVALAQDSFNAFTPGFREFLTGQAIDELKAKYPNAQIDQAEANLSGGKHAEAVSGFKEFLAHNSDSRQKIVYSLELADALQRMGNTYAAITVCDEVTNELFAIPDENTNEETLNFLNCIGAFYRTHDESEKAKRCFEEVLELCQKQKNTKMLQKSVAAQRAEQEMLRVYLKDKDFNSALPLAKRYPPDIKVHSTGFDITIGRSTCGEGFALFFGPKGKSYLSPDLLTYQRGVKNLNRRSLADAEREFLKSSRATVDPSIRRASLIALCETYRQWSKPRKSMVALSDYFEIAQSPL